MPQETKRWVRCPKCDCKLFAVYQPEIDVETDCHQCKGVYRFTRNENGILSYTTVRRPKRTKHLPSEYK